MDSSADLVPRAALDTPFLLLPFRPGVDQSGAKLFIRSFFKGQYDRDNSYAGESLHYELRLRDPMVSTLSESIYATIFLGALDAVLTFVSGPL